MLAGTRKPMLGTKLKKAHPLAKGLVGCWLFNEGGGDKAYDLSGYNNHGTLKKMAFPPTTVSGWNPNKDGVCLAFDGSIGNINCGYDASLNITDAITIEVLAKATSLTTTHVIISNTHLNAFGYDVSITSLGSLRYETAQSGATQISYVPNGTITTGTWYRIVVVRNGSAARLYVNSVDKTSVFGSHIDPVSSSYPLHLGTYRDIGNYFNGSIASVKIYHRALSEAEIKWLYHEPYAMFERGELLL